MDEFKIRSIDEFDADFLKSRQSGEASSQSSTQSDVTPSNTIYEIDKNKDYSPEDEVYSSSANDEQPQKPFEQYETSGSSTPDNMPYEPLTKSSGINVDGLKLPFHNGEDDDDDDEEYEKPAKKKSKQKKSKGKTAGKVISIIMLVATVLMFVFGCFIAVFVDNTGAALGGYNFSTVNSATPAYNLSKGDLVISQTPTDEPYCINDLIAVRSESVEGCEIKIIKNIGYGEENAVTDFTVQSAVDGVQEFVNVSNSAGIVKYYIPACGTLIHFAMDNIILVSVLFVLLIALWSLVLILIEKSSHKPTGKKEY